MSVPDVKPANYGEWWNRNTKDDAWYREIHDARESIHAAFAAWVDERDRTDQPIRSVLEIGCGRGVRYPALVADRRYVGYDISIKEIEWCRANRPNPRHAYVAGDFIADGIDERFDLVFAHALIDHVYDIDAFLHAVVNATDRWVYLTAYRGWFPDLTDHRYSWSEQDTCFYNDLSPARVQALLTALGCRPLRVGRSDTVVEPIGWETLIIGERVSPRPVAKEADWDWLVAHAACPACVAPRVLQTRHQRSEGAYYECGRCHRVYPVDGRGIIDFQVHDRVAALPEAALDVWALGQRRACGLQRRESPAVVAWEEAARARPELHALDGAEVLDLSGVPDASASVRASLARQYVALAAPGHTHDGRCTRVRAWPEWLPFEDQVFDVVIVGRALDRTLCLESSLRELARVLRPGGVLHLWVTLAAGETHPRGLFPPLTGRSEHPVLEATSGWARRQAAVEQVARRTASLDRLEADAGHLLVDRAYVRRVPLRFVKIVSPFGFTPVDIDVRDDPGRGVAPVALVALRKDGTNATADSALLRHVDLVVEAARVGEQVAALARRVEAIATRSTSDVAQCASDVASVAQAVTGLRDELHREADALRHLIGLPRTPSERVFRRVVRWWRGEVAPSE
jgi:SAM-dependent methyltransferase